MSSLEDFTDNAVKIFEELSISIVNNVPFKNKPIFVTEDEKNSYESIDNATKDEIEEKIMETIKLLDHDCENLYYELFQKDTKRKKREEYLKFLTIVESELADSNIEEVKKGEDIASSISAENCQEE